MPNNMFKIVDPSEINLEAVGEAVAKVMKGYVSEDLTAFEKVTDNAKKVEEAKTKCLKILEELEYKSSSFNQILQVEVLKAKQELQKQNTIQFNQLQKELKEQNAIQFNQLKEQNSIQFNQLQKELEEQVEQAKTLALIQ